MAKKAPAAQPVDEAVAPSAEAAPRIPRGAHVGVATDTFVGRIQEWLGRLGWTPVKLALQAGLPEKVVANWFDRQLEPAVEPDQIGRTSWALVQGSLDAGLPDGGPELLARVHKELTEATLYDGRAVGFRKVLRDHLRELDWKQSELADRAQIPPSDISSWLNLGNRALNRVDVCKIAMAVARGYAEGKSKKEQALGFGQLDGILNEMLTAAGYSAITGRRQDAVWNRLSDAVNISFQDRSGSAVRTLHVGWVKVAWLARQGHVANVPEGFAIEITKRVAAILGFRLEWHQYDLSKVITALREGEIDLIAPMLLHLPVRSFLVGFSDPIPGLRVGFNAVIAPHLRKAVVLDSVGGEGPRTIRDVDPSKVVFHFLTHGIGKPVVDIFFPDDRNVQARASDLNMRQAAQFVLDSPTAPDGRIRCLVTDQLTCLDFSEERGYDKGDPYRGCLLLAKPRMRFTTGFAAHHDETKLLQVINVALKLVNVKALSKSCEADTRALVAAKILKLPPEGSRRKASPLEG